MFSLSPSTPPTLVFLTHFSRYWEHAGGYSLFKFLMGTLQDLQGACFSCEGFYGDSANTVIKPQFSYVDEATWTLVESELSS